MDDVERVGVRCDREIWTYYLDVDCGAALCGSVGGGDPYLVASR